MKLLIPIYQEKTVKYDRDTATVVPMNAAPLTETLPQTAV